MKRILAILALALLPALCPAESLLLSNAIIHTVSGPILTNAQVWIQGEKIAGVGPGLKAAGAKVVDLKGQHVYPGIIVPTSSLGLVEIGAVRATVDTTEVGAYTPDVQSWVAVNPDSELLPVARAGGITHFLAVPQGGVVSGQSGLMRMDGWTTEQKKKKKPVALHVFWPSMELDYTPKEELSDRSKWKSPEDQAKERGRKLKELDDFFSEARAYALAREKSPSATLMNPAWEGMMPLIRGEVPLMIHADQEQQLRAALAWATNRKFKIVFSGARDAWRLADALATNQIPVIYSSTFDQPSRDTDSYDVHFRAPSVLQRAGVKVLFAEGLGSMDTANTRNVPYAAAQAVAFGLPEDEAVKGLTLYPAQVLGVADKLGSLEAGKEASIIVCTGSILDIRQNVTRMWISGSEVPLDSRHTRLYDKYRLRPVR